MASERRAHSPRPSCAARDDRATEEPGAELDRVATVRADFQAGEPLRVSPAARSHDRRAGAGRPSPVVTAASGAASAW